MPAFGASKAPSAAAATFDEIFDRMPAPKDLAQVRVENGGVQPIPLEAATQVERTATSQNSADKGNVQINAGGDVRQAQTLVINDVTQQQVVDVTAVTRHVNYLVVLRFFMQRFHVLHFEPIVDAIPHPAEKALNYANGRVGYVRRNFAGKAAGFLRRTFQLDPVVRGFCINRGQNTRIIQHVVEQSATMRQVRANRSDASLAKVNAQNSRYLAKCHLGFKALLHDRT